jgi:hypothetical protein
MCPTSGMPRKYSSRGRQYDELFIHATDGGHVTALHQLLSANPVRARGMVLSRSRH